MSETFEYWKASPDAVKALAACSTYVAASGLERRLVNLISLRASQLNGCAYCCDMHTTEALAEGESPQRLHVVAAWREAGNLFSPAEQAALDWTENLTRFADAKAADVAARDRAYEKLMEHFTAKQAVDITVAIASINSWNRVAVGFHRQPPKR